MRIGKSILISTVLGIVTMLFSTALAQEKQGILLTTDPAGATAYLTGEYKVVANTPARLPINITGRYKTRIIRPGYEQWKGELTFVPGGAGSVNIQLSRKTRVKATLRSLFIPGWGQYYSGSSWRGAALTTGALVAAGFIYAADRNYQRKRSDFDIANANYNNATDLNREALRMIRDSKQSAAYQAETDRRTAIFAGVAVWAYNVLDAIIFFPSGEAYYPTVSSLDGGGATLSLNVKF